MKITLKPTKTEVYIIIGLIIFLLIYLLYDKHQQYRYYYDKYNEAIKAIHIYEGIVDENQIIIDKYNWLINERGTELDGIL